MILRSIEFFAPHHGVFVEEARDDVPHRAPYYPGDDLSALPAHVQAVISGEWTPEVVDAYAAFKAAEADAAAVKEAERAATAPPPNPILEALAAITARLDKLDGG